MKANLIPLLIRDGALNVGQQLLEGSRLPSPGHVRGSCGISLAGVHTQCVKAPEGKIKVQVQQFAHC